MIDKIKALISKMTLEEKAGLCSGYDFWSTKPIKRLGLPGIATSDGPHGLRKENDDDERLGMKNSFPATAFPPAVNIASSWSVDAAQKLGEELGKQCLDQNVSVILGPGINIKRSPLCGRNFEYMSEDPYLAGKLSRKYIEGTQSYNVSTSLKHFCANNQEKRRMTINSVVDERALREIYLAGFEEAVKAQPDTVMCSYNKLNGTYLSDNKRLLTDILRDEWGFKGIVVSDWNALNDRVEAIKAGLDLEMPSCGGSTDRQIVKAVKNGEILEKDLDVIVERLLTFIIKSYAHLQPDYKADYEKAHEVAREIAEQSIVLLKNQTSTLPLSEDKEESVAVIGELAKQFRYQGSGSSRINPYRLVNFIDALELNGKKYEYAPAYDVNNDQVDENLLQSALELAKSHKQVLLFVGLTDQYESESYDRTHMDIPKSHKALIEAVTEVNPNAVVVLFGGSPVEMPWIDKVDTLINAYLPGEAGGEALYNILFGKVNPSGKLAETYPLASQDNISSKYFPMGPKNVEYRESVYVGYRYFDSADKEVLFPFGYGLSYTTFEYSDLTIDGLSVSYTVKNVGDVDGYEISQLYVSDPNPIVFKAKKELKGFEKTFIKKGESVNVTHTLDYRSFAFYNTAISDWYAQNGEYEILIGASSRDIRLKGKIKVDFEQSEKPVPDYKTLCPAYCDIANAQEIPDNDFAALYGGEIPENTASKRGSFDYNATIGEMKACLVGKIIVKVAPSIIKDQVPNADITTMMILQQGMEEMPLRGLIGISSGLIHRSLVDGMLYWGNKKYFKGFFKVIGGIFATLRNLQQRNKIERRKRSGKTVAVSEEVQEIAQLIREQTKKD
ncbi:MAG: glycoside hydrolase family 3 C-terminal domain-containing protein [Clostridia bacterium]|nr:glycoside hydrolase family 3 C-terminal domain-containing protein [Clostridia bacterium]